MSFTVKRSTSLEVKWFISLAVKRFTSLAVKQFTSLAVKRSTSLVVHKLSSQTVHKLSSQAAHEFSGHPAVNPISAGSHGSSENVCAVVCGAVHLASFSPPLPSLFFFLPLFYQCDGCLEWGLMAGLGGFASRGGSFLSGHSGSPWISQAPTFHLSEAVG